MNKDFGIPARAEPVPASGEGQELGFCHIPPLPSLRIQGMMRDQHSRIPGDSLGSVPLCRPGAPKTLPGKKWREAGK